MSKFLHAAGRRQGYDNTLTFSSKTAELKTNQTSNPDPDAAKDAGAIVTNSSSWTFVQAY